MKMIKVLFAASEVTPFAKVGGLADVVGALPKALLNIGVDAKVIMPYYGSITLGGAAVETKKKDIEVPFAGTIEKVTVHETALPNSRVVVWLVEHQRYLGQGSIYNSNDPKVSETTRFAFFARAVISVVESIGWWPDILHCHDWHVGMIPLLIKTLGKRNERIRRIRTLLTIHNLALQGQHNAGELLYQLGISQDEHPALAVRDQNGKDLVHLATGILTADKLNTVSPTYAKEILTPAYGAGLEGVLRQREHDLTGILNGIDTERFNPETDASIAHRYSARTAEKKRGNKKKLQERCHLPVNTQQPVVGIVSRLTEQKGFRLITDGLLTLPFQLVVLGSGEHEDEDHFTQIALKHPQNSYVRIGFDAELAQQIYSGSDLFLMPSRFEPCGLGQMIAMRYGSIPIVRKTGGLADTVQDIDPASGTGEGFVFDQFTPQALEDAVRRSLALWEKPDLWHTVVTRIMEKDFSWTASAQKYAATYQTLIDMQQETV